MTLSARVLRQVLLVAGGAFLLFAVLFLGLYREQLARERAASAELVNRLLRVALENAMLKRDVPGLRDIVSQLGRQPGITGVMILAPGGEVRFASRPEQLGQQLPQLTAGLIPGETLNQFIAEPGQPEVLRSRNPVPNQPPCTGCHGPLDAHPLNGVLVVDFAADSLRQQAWHSAALFAAAGLAVLGLTLASLWWGLRRRVIAPLARLDRAARGLAAGDEPLVTTPLAEWAEAPDAEPHGADEITRLAHSFQQMAGQLATQLQRSRDQQAFLQELLDGLPDGLRVIRVADARILAVNAAYCRQLGQSPEAAVGQTCHRSSHGREQPCAATLVVCPLRELQQPGQSLQCRHHHRHADGREVPVEVHAVLLERQGEHGPERLLLETTVDLSQRVRHSQEQRLAELGLLAAGIAHEIHNPLGSMRLAVEGLLRNLRQGQEEPRRLVGYLEMMNAEIDRCTGITQRLLLLSRLPEQQPQRVALHPAVADTLALLEFDARSHGIIQQLDLAAGEPSLLADDSDLRMLVLNLVQNAHHAMPHGGPLRVSTRRLGEQVEIAIEDSGCGIPAEVLPRIFDPFYSRRADGEGGTGLGLTICKSIVDRYGGRIALSSQPGVGTTFRVYFPLLPE